MTRINHERPIFKLLASLRRDKSISLPVALSRLEGKYSSISTDGRASIKMTKAQERKIIHEIAIGIFDHVERYSDVRAINRLTEYLEDQVEKKALLEWFCRFGRVSIRTDTGKFGFSKNNKVDRSSAIAHPYWTLIPKSTPNRAAFNFIHELEKVVGKATERMLNPLPGDQVDLSLLGEVKSLLRNR